MLQEGCDTAIGHQKLTELYETVKGRMKWPGQGHGNDAHAFMGTEGAQSQLSYLPLYSQSAQYNAV